MTKKYPYDENEVVISSNKILHLSQAILAKKIVFGIVRVRIKHTGGINTSCCNMPKQYDQIWDDVLNHLSRMGINVIVEDEYKDGEFWIRKIDLEEK